MHENPPLCAVTSIDDVPTHRKVPQMIRVPATPPLQGVVISASLYKLPTHFDGSITRLCMSPGPCSLCNVRELRLYYLIGLYDRGDGARKWVQLSADAARSLLSQLTDMQRELYGACVRIARERKVITAPIVCQVEPYTKVHGSLPKAITPDETIALVFGTPDCPRQRKTKPVKL